MSFDPAAIPNMGGWWKADAIVGLADGAPVATWPDSSGHSFDATASGAATYHTNQLGGQPALSFDTTDTYSCAQEGSFPGGVTIFVVVKPASFAGNPTIYAANATGGLSFRLTTAGNAQLNKVNTSQIGLAATPVTLGAWAILTTDFTDAGTGAPWHLFTNGAANGSGTSATQFTAGIAGSFIGHRPGGNSTDNWNGQLAELIVYERALTNTERAQVHSYLQDKYGIAVADYIAPDTAPTAAAGPDQAVTAGEQVTLDGSGSTDPDAGDSITYAWSHVSGPYAGALSNPTAQKLTYTPTAAGVDVWQLVVTDSHGAASSPDTVSVTVSADAPAAVRELPVPGAWIVVDGVATYAGWAGRHG